MNLPGFLVRVEIGEMDTHEAFSCRRGMAEMLREFARVPPGRVSPQHKRRATLETEVLLTLNQFELRASVGWALLREQHQIQKRED